MTVMRRGERRKERSLTGQGLKFMLVIQVSKNNTLTQVRVIQVRTSLHPSHPVPHRYTINLRAFTKPGWLHLGYPSPFCSHSSVLSLLHCCLSPRAHFPPPPVSELSLLSQHLFASSFKSIQCTISSLPAYQAPLQSLNSQRICVLSITLLLITMTVLDTSVFNKYLLK